MHRTPWMVRQLRARQVWHGRMLPAAPDQLQHSLRSFLGRRYQSSLEEVQFTLLSKKYKFLPQLLQYNNWNNKDAEQSRAFIF